MGIGRTRPHEAQLFSIDVLGQIEADGIEFVVKSPASDVEFFFVLFYVFVEVYEPADYLDL